MDLRERTVLITGGTGFIGSHLAARLVQVGAHVHVLVRPGSDPARLSPLGDRIRLHRGDLTDALSLRASLEASRASLIFHLAGNTRGRRLDADLGQLDTSVQDNLQGTLNLVQAAHHGRSGVERLIRVGGLEEYGRGPAPYREEQREEPVSPYSASQTAATHYCRMLQPYVDFDLVTLRLALVYGPAQSTAFFIPSLITHCLRGQDFEMTSGEQGRDLLYVDDVVDALVRTATAPGLAGEVINVCSGVEHTIREVAEAIRGMTGGTSEIRVGAARERSSEILHLVGSNEKAKRLLGWSPTTSLREGLTRCIAWYEEQAEIIGAFPV
ncbi:MAG TPA: NAD-dependent epimerase/dehydratase family protein [Rhodothermales bacterium]|nr:NAD-dependent epimerase/dehydratase family protein [Rhodothermales bacterium]